MATVDISRIGSEPQPEPGQPTLTGFPYMDQQPGSPTTLCFPMRSTVLVSIGTPACCPTCWTISSASLSQTTIRTGQSFILRGEA